MSERQFWSNVKRLRNLDPQGTWYLYDAKYKTPIWGGGGVQVLSKVDAHVYQGWPQERVYPWYGGNVEE